MAVCAAIEIGIEANSISRVHRFIDCRAPLMMSVVNQENIMLRVPGCQGSLQHACVPVDFFGLYRDQRLFEILAGFKHVLEMEGGDFEAPGVSERVAHVFADDQQDRMRQRYHALLERFAFGRDSKFDVDRIGMPDRDARLQPTKMNLPGAAEWVWPDLELTKILNHLG